MSEIRKTRGLEKLHSAIGDKSQTAVAEELGISKASFHYIYKGRRPPTLDQAISIQLLYNIEPADWVK